MTGQAKLIAAQDAHFAWMLGEEGGPDGLCLPDGGVDRPAVLKYLRRLAEALRSSHGSGSWLVVAAGEVTGLCGYKRCPAADGVVEIGYGIAPSRRRRGLATDAVAAMIEHAGADGRITRLTAETAIDNLASQRVLTKNGFASTGGRTDPEDGPLVLWSRELR